MSARSQPIPVRISGPFALFTRPEMKVERVSYDVITPSAARGVLEAVLWKPGMRWIIQRIKVLAPIRFTAFKRNEVSSKIPSTFSSWAAKNSVDRPFFADDDRAQRNSVVLRDVDYVVEGVIEMTTLAGPDDNLNKFVEMFKRRVEKGQHFQQPYLGCREFPATVSLARGDEAAAEEHLSRDSDLGWMLHDIEYGADRPLRAHFFDARMRFGVIEIPPASWREPR